MSRDVYKEHEAMADTLEELDKMFTVLDEYRKKKDKRLLFKVHHLESRAREMMKAIAKAMNESSDNNTESNKAA